MKDRKSNNCKNKQQHARVYICILLRILNVQIHAHAFMRVYAYVVSRMIKYTFMYLFFLDKFISLTKGGNYAFMDIIYKHCLLFLLFVGIILNFLFKFFC